MYLPTEREKKIISVLFTAPDMILTEEELLERSGAGKRALEGCLIKGFIQKTSLYGYTLIETGRQAL